ncbi:hypothetical protein [Dactylosporangium sp. CA-233914]|uniref:hypothetical protein n=1 Tax=Dactylosporangium sp. CA-233914 TaxID=3239934 RepID=UPI003D93420A
MRDRVISFVSPAAASNAEDSATAAWWIAGAVVVLLVAAATTGRTGGALGERKLRQGLAIGRISRSDTGRR